MKETHPANWMTDHISAHSFFVGVNGEIVTSSGASVPDDLFLYSDGSVAYNKYELVL
jgi:hypothetical protein